MNTVAAMQARSGTVRGASPRAREGGGSSGWMRCHSASGSRRSARVIMGADHPNPSVLVLALAIRGPLRRDHHDLSWPAARIAPWSTTSSSTATSARACRWPACAVPV
jgi:hypothetical protein